MARTPDFIGIGPSKTASTWMAVCLAEHPEIYLPIKELHFFSWEERWQKGYDWYESFFKKCPASAKKGEVSTTYFFTSSAPERIYTRYPNTKIITCLRNPADRIYSNYLHSLRFERLAPQTSLKEALKERPIYLESTRYATHLKNYLKLFPQEQILILIYEDIFKNPLAFVRSIYKFIGVNDNFTPPSLNEKLNVGLVSRRPEIERWLLLIANRLQIMGMGFNKIINLLKRFKIDKLLIKLNTNRTKTENHKLTSQERQELNDYFKEEIEKLEMIINRKLTAWY